MKFDINTEFSLIGQPAKNHVKLKSLISTDSLKPYCAGARTRTHTPFELHFADFLIISSYLEANGNCKNEYLPKINGKISENYTSHFIVKFK